MRKVILLLSILAVGVFGATLSEIKSSNTIKIGVRKDFPPFGSLENGELSGFEVELAKEVGKYIVGEGGNITLVPLSAKDRIPMLQNGQIDVVIAQFTATPEREKVVDFSIPYFADTMSIISSADLQAKSVNNFKSLLVIPGSTSEEYIKQKVQNFRNITIKNCENLMDCYSKLQNGEADGYFHTTFAIAAIPVLNNKYQISVKSVGIPSFIAAGVSKGNDDLKAAVTNAILEISKGGFFKDAYDKTINIYYKGTLDKNMFLLDDIYKAFMYN